MPADWPTRFATLWRNFLAAAPPETGIPGLANLPKKTSTDTSKLKRPRIIVTCEQIPTAHPREFKGTVKIVHGIKVTPDGGEPAEAATVNEALVAYLRDDAAWLAFIQTLPLEERAGWRVVRARVQNIETETDEENHTRDFTIPVTLYVVTK
jgi:hypothetical protein